MRNIGPIILAMTLLGACSGNPLDSLMKLSEVDVADSPAATVVETPTAIADETTDTASVVDAILKDQAPDTASGGGFFSRMMDAARDTFTADPATAQPTPDATALSVQDIGAAVTATPATDSLSEPLPEPTPAAAPAPARAGFFGRLFGGGAEAEPEVTPASAPGGGLFGLGRAPAVPDGPDKRMVDASIRLDFGEIARNCSVARRDMGTKVGEEAGFTLYDTVPNSIERRTHFITGFDDRCARQFTAATAIMSDIGTHEVVRYLPSNKKHSYSATDNAYETLKNAYCRVSRGKPCGDRLDRLARDTTFITAYRAFGTNPSWHNILLHDGQVLEMGANQR